VSTALKHCHSTAAALVVILGLGVSASSAAPIANPVANFSGLDKISARVTHFDAYTNETVQFGSLQITPRACYTQPADEAQRTAVFVEVDRVNLKGATTRIFTGWMFADSPALNAVDDAVYDFWLVDCKQHSDVPPPRALNLPPTLPQAAGSRSQSASASANATPAAPVETGSIITLATPRTSASAGN